MKLWQRIKQKLSVSGCLALLVAVDGYLILAPVLYRALNDVPATLNRFNTWKEALNFVGLLEIPRFMIGFSLLLMAIGLELKVRIAWIITLLLLISITVLNLFIFDDSYRLTFYSTILIITLQFYWRSFNHVSLAGGSLFALLSILSLLLYAVLGTLYIGDEFSPPVNDLMTAFYFSIVSMSTVGFGDIVPRTSDARLFTLSIIILGITLFAASLTVIIAPMISNNIRRIVKGRISHVIRKNHFIIVGCTPLTLNIYQGLHKRGDAVTVVCYSGNILELPQDADILIGDPSAISTLKDAGAEKAKCIIALDSNDANNVFIILAAKEIAGPTTKIISLVNESQNLPKIKRVSPDMLFSLPLLASELLIRTLSGEKIDNNLITKLFFGSCSNID